jgi:hypothetical protein
MQSDGNHDWCAITESIMLQAGTTHEPNCTYDTPAKGHDQPQNRKHRLCAVKKSRKLSKAFFPFFFFIFFSFGSLEYLSDDLEAI